MKVILFINFHVAVLSDNNQHAKKQAMQFRLLL